MSKQGELIGKTREMTMSNFFHSMILQRPKLDAGKYVLAIDVIWDKCVKLDPLYDDVLVRAFC